MWTDKYFILLVHTFEANMEEVSHVIHIRDRQLMGM